MLVGWVHQGKMPHEAPANILDGFELNELDLNPVVKVMEAPNLLKCDLPSALMASSISPFDLRLPVESNPFYKGMQSNKESESLMNLLGDSLNQCVLVGASGTVNHNMIVLIEYCQ